MGTFGNTTSRRRLSKVTLTQDGFGNWEVRVEYFDDDTEDRQGGFACRAAAHGWAQTRLERHFRLGVPGRLG